MTRIEVAPSFALNVEVAGRGSPLVLLHGFTGSATSWGAFGDQLRERFTTVAVDIAGHGASDAPAELDHYRMPQVVEDLVEAVRLAGWPRAAWLGYSMGGRTALHVAARHPEAVDRLILIGGSPGLATEAERRARRAADEALADRVEGDGVPNFVDYWENIPLFASQRALSPEQRAAIRARRMACDPRGLANSLRGMGTGAQEPLHERLAAMEMPVLAMAGALDEKFTAIAHEMAAVLPRATVEIIAGAGHAAHLEAPETCARATFAFLEAHQTQGVRP